ncbi:LptF/LptG family permease [Gluconobacter oxydans]|uniref:LptF/LptG family permease n=1 Tax=Gluconobacter oxydans TaxID=442 RepID=UPI00346475D6
MSDSTPAMPRHVLIKALNRALLGRFLLCGTVLVSLLEILALLEKTTPILNRHLGFRGILTFAFLHLPALSIDILPLAFMVGALFLLTQMTLSSEISALRAAGLSTPALYRLLLPAVLIAGIGGTCAQYWLVPACENALTTWWNRTDPLAGQDGQPEDNILWFRAGPTLVRIGQIAQGGTFLRDVTIYHRDNTGLLTGTEHANVLTYRDGQWHPDGAQDLSLSDDKSYVNVTKGDSTFVIPATPSVIMTLSQNGATVTPAQVSAILHKGAPASLPRATYRMALFSGMILPVDIAVMLLLTLPVIYIPPRAGLRNPLPVYVLAAGMGFVILQGMISALGNAGTLPAPLAVSVGPLLGTLLGLTWLLRMEER